jgi:hypothetical protein
VINSIRISRSALLLACVVLPACASTTGADAPGTPPGAGNRAPAAALRTTAGDTVYLIEHYIRAERRQHFEDFVAQVLLPAFERLSAPGSPRRDALQAVRLLRSIEPDADGAFVYTFVLDPYVRGESYNVLELLGEVYPPEQARREYDRFTEMWARDFTARAFVQASGPAR